jgi:peptidoglycan/xylan/chitin deacetylase (PgdA/CDA1 family)
MLRRELVAMLLASAALPAVAGVPRGLISPELRIAKGGAAAPRVALTFDACMGAVDMRIVDALLTEKVPATIFVTGRWLRSNREATALMLAHPEIFELENHGAMHLPAVTSNEPIYGIRTAGSIEAVMAEVTGGAAAMVLRGIPHPAWYRDATALYSDDALIAIRAMGYRIAGFSLNADYGASLSREGVLHQMAKAEDGEVLIGHINQPRHASGAAYAEGIRALKARGFGFVRLKDVPEAGAWGEPPFDPAKLG